MSISSPCIGVCVLEGPAGICAGCGRTIGEITSWRTMSEEARLDLMAVLPERLAALRDISVRPEAERGDLA